MRDRELAKNDVDSETKCKKMSEDSKTKCNVSEYISL